MPWAGPEDTHIDRYLKTKGLSRKVSYLGPNFSAAANSCAGINYVGNGPFPDGLLHFQGFCLGGDTSAAGAD